MRSSLSSLLTILALISAAFGFQRQAPPGVSAPPVQYITITARVLLNSRPAPAGILVRLEDAYGSQVSALMTDSRGEVEFSQLNPLIYRVLVTQREYRPVSQELDGRYAPRLTAVLELRPILGQSVPNVSPGGPADTISVNLPSSGAGKKFLQQGETALFQNNNPEKGLRFFDKLIKSDADYANGWILRGTSLLRLNRAAEAEMSFKKAISIDPKSYAAHYALGVSLNAQHSFQEAIAALNQSLAINPQAAEAQLEISRSFLALNEWQQAEPHSEQAVMLAPASPVAHVMLGNIYLKAGKLALALKEFEEYPKLAPAGPLAAQVTSIIDKIRKQLQQPSVQLQYVPYTEKK